MAFSKRLNMVLQQILPCDFLADIGTDHGYIPILAVQEGRAKRAAAADISQGSCNKALANIQARGLQACIDVRCGSGLEVIKEGEQPNCIVISGMGGLLVLDILKGSPQVTERAGQLVLQPQRDIDKVRRFVLDHGFHIADEDMLFEDGKYYTVLSCVRGKAQPYTECEYLFGKRLIEKKSPVLKAYCSFEYNKLKGVIQNIESNSGEENDSRKKQLEHLKGLYEEVLKCL